ncbi:DNA-protecting protein DprA [Oscillospiraceae bacterium HV4-5-C5C]|nr:DNA-protecting protein DprA [Oscillospiraceae bacterium HV4-5-C5C]
MGNLKHNENLLMLSFLWLNRLIDSAQGKKWLNDSAAGVAPELKWDQALILDYFSLSEAQQARLFRALDLQSADPDILSCADYCAEENIQLISLADPLYPAYLKEISSPPLVLFVKGQGGEALLSSPASLTVVGARNCTPYGINCTSRLLRPLAAAGCCIVSGLARGIDGQAHMAALAARGKTIAILPGGVDVCYPAEHRHLYQQIQLQGAVISEQWPGTRPQRSYFAARNRLLSGLSQATLVIESSQRSGTLITVDHALRQGREVLAVPGSIYSPLSVGTNQLIKEGATPVTGIQDLWSVLNINPPAVTVNDPLMTAVKRYQLDQNQSRLLAILSAGPLNYTEIARLDFAREQVQQLIFDLECCGLIQLYRGKYTVRWP